MLFVRLVSIFALVFLLAACEGEKQTSEPRVSENSVDDSHQDDGLGVGSAQADFQVYKSPTCGCCGEWIEHLNNSGFTTAAHHPDDLALLKEQKGVGAEYQSCHTAVSQQGYVFEGHVPASVMEEFLAAPPEGAIGLAVPGMPVGSPGMEMGDRFTPYNVLLLLRDGGSEVYRHIASASEQ